MTRTILPVIRRAALALTALALAAPAAEAQVGALRVDLNIPSSRLVVYEGDRVLRTYPISVGMLGHDTPTGSFTIDHAEWNPWWRPPAREWAKNDKDTPPGPNNPMGRVKLFFEPLYFIHGTPDAENIGRPASHGCVRMLNKDVIALARLLHERAAPQVTSAQIDRILSNSRQTRRVDFRESIPLTIRYDQVAVEGDRVVLYPDVYRRNALHTEGVYQALLAAGYDIREVQMGDVRRLLERAKGRKTPLTLSVEEAFGRSVAAARAGAVATH